MDAEKTCKKCDATGPADRFRGLVCLPCKAKAGRDRYLVNRDAVKVTPKRKRCTKCGVVKSRSGFHKSPNSADGLASHCKSCRSDKTKVQRVAGHLRSGRQGWRALANSAKYRELLFDITLDEYVRWWADTPNVCRYCGSDFAAFARHRDAIMHDDRLQWLREAFANRNHAAITGMSVDRRDPRQGYTLANICKACWLCNYVKGAIISEKLMIPIARDLRRQITDVGWNG